MAETQNLEEVAKHLARELTAVYGREEVLAALDRVAPEKWPGEYVNRETGRVYKPHHEKERLFVTQDAPRQLLAKGGEGGGKSVAGIVKCLERLRRQMSGIMVSNDLPHFKRSLWPEFQRWCPWEQVDPKHQYRRGATWEPYAPFMMAFKNGAMLWCGGMDEPGAWEGPNVNFAFMDEMRRKKKPDVLKVLDGRIRIPGPNGEPPQIWQTTTPKKHWLYEYYGPLKCRCRKCGGGVRVAIQEGQELVCPICGSDDLQVTDKRAAFKHDSMVITLLTVDNEPNLERGFTRKRAQSLSEAEARVLLEAAWEDYEEGQRFLPTMLWWDQLREDLPSLGKQEPLVVALDAAAGRTSGPSDCFGMIGVTRHPTQHDAIAVRYVRAWQAQTGGKIDFLGTEHQPGPERELRKLCETHRVVCVPYDPYQLNDMAVRLTRERIAWMKSFGQVNRRAEADADLLRLIQEGRVAHDGDALLREHLDNADRKVDGFGHKMRIVKREDAYKVDLAVALSMAAYECLRLNL